MKILFGNNKKVFESSFRKKENYKVFAEEGAIEMKCIVQLQSENEEKTIKIVLEEKEIN